MKFVIATLLLVSVSAFAQDKDKGAMFQEMKTNMLTSFDKRIQDLQTAKGCVSAATNPEQVKTCRAALKASNRAWKDEMKSKHGGMKAKREAMRERKRAEKKD